MAKEQQQPTPYGLIFLLLLGIAAAGSWVGMPANYGALQERGFCSDLCHGSQDHPDEKSCAEQRSCLAVPSNLGSSLLNFLALPLGIIVDLIPVHVSYTIGNLILIIGANLNSISPLTGVGYTWAVPLCCAGCMMVFMVSISKLIPKLVPERHIALVSGLYSSSWDGGVAAAPLMGVLLKMQSNSSSSPHHHGKEDVYNDGFYFSIQGAFAIISLSVLPSMIGILCAVNFKEINNSNDTADDEEKKKQSEETSGEKEKQHQEQHLTEKSSLIEKPRPKSPAPPGGDTVLSLILRVIRYRQLWTLCCCSVSAVAYGYFALSNVNEYVSSSACAPGHRANARQTHDFEFWASILMGVLAPAAIVPVEKLYMRYGWVKTIRMMGFIQASILAIIILCVSLGTLPWQAQYATWVLIVLVRMSAFGTVTIGWGIFAAARNDSGAAGTGLGVIYTFGGGISVIVGYLTTTAVQQDAIGGNVFRIVHGVFAGVCLLLHLVQSFTIVDEFAAPTEEGTAAVEMVVGGKKKEAAEVPEIIVAPSSSTEGKSPAKYGSVDSSS